MNFWETITGSDMTKAMKAFDARAAALPADYQAAWEAIKANLAPHSNMSGRNLMPILDDALGLLEISAADGLAIDEVLGDDIPGLCAAMVGAQPRGDYRDKWRAQLNRNVARKLDRLGG